MPILTADERIGRTIAGKYRLDRILGEGGMGVVYAGSHLRLNTPVAVKFLHPAYSQHKSVVERFLREAQATARLSHPNIVSVRDVDIDTDGSVYMVLEMLEGESLATLLARRRSLSLDETLRIALPIMDALSYAHSIGITHRDVKPDNIFVSVSGDQLVPKLLDFGIAKLTEGPSSHTATGAVLGTALYMAPEQAMGRKEVGPKADVWAIALVVYECLTGTVPYEADLADAAPAAILLSLMTSRIVELRERRPDLPVALSDALAQAMQRDPGQRTESVAKLRSALHSLPASPNTKPQIPLPTLGDQATTLFRPALTTGPDLATRSLLRPTLIGVGAVTLCAAALLTLAFVNRATTTVVTELPGAWTSVPTTTPPGVPSTPVAMPTAEPPMAVEAPTPPLADLPSVQQARPLARRQERPTRPRAERSVPEAQDDPLAALDSPPQARRMQPAREEVRTMKRMLEPLIQACGTGAGESAVVQFAIAGATGQATSIEVSGVTSEASRRCVGRVIQSRARFPLFAEASIQLAWRFDLR